MRSGWTTAVVVILSLFVIVVAAGQLFFAGGESVSTETAFNYGFDEEVPFEGVILRDEALVYNSDAGVLSYERADGFKAGNSTVIARRYKNDSDIAYLREIEQLEEQIAMLESAELLIGTDNSQLEAISAQINESHSGIIGSIIDGDFAAASGERGNLLRAMCKREITLKESGGYSEKKQELRARISELRKLISGGVREVHAGGTGYFVSAVDGYEGEFGYSDVEMMTADRVNAIIERPRKSAPPNSIGKLVSDYHWRAAAIISTDKMVGSYAGSEAILRVGSDSRLYKTNIISVENCGDGKAVYVFECDNFVRAAVEGRVLSLKLVRSSYNGLRVSRKALRFDENGEHGVFILRGQTLAFRKVNVAYWGEGYVICTQETGDDYLKLYDQVVVGGRDLYDGKVV